VKMIIWPMGLPNMPAPGLLPVAAIN